ncbi:MAG: response regulator [Chloroflexi bacterium]|nr:response regulator [Chloroflexota bacterium]
MVEDNPGDVRLVMEVLRETRTNRNISVVRDGDDALKFLRKKGKYKNAPHPHFILLDINLPKKTGHEVLKELKQDKHLKHIPVIVLTSSRSDDDILKAYNLHANCYVTKPGDFEEFLNVIRSIEDFWLNTVKLPPRQ